MPANAPSRLATAVLKPSRDPLGKRVGVLLCNTGTPGGTGYLPMVQYLAEYLDDPRVRAAPRWSLPYIIEPFLLAATPTSRRAHQRVWDHARNESPLMTHTRRQAEKLQLALGIEGRPGNDSPVVEWAMRYGARSIDRGLKHLLSEGCERVLLVPLYPQYSSMTTATTCDALFESLRGIRIPPIVRVAPPYYDEGFYIDALANAIAQKVAALDFRPQVLVASFASPVMPDGGEEETYVDQCETTGELLRQVLGQPREAFMVTYQAGRRAERFLLPDTRLTLEALARAGVSSVVTVTPGYAADGVESIDEVGRECANAFRNAGGLHFARIECLNDSTEGMYVIEALVRRELRGWSDHACAFEHAV